MPDRLTIINFLLFQLGWFVCVLSGAAQLNSPAVIFTVAFLIIHFRFYPWKQTDYKLVLAAILIGVVLDSSWSAWSLMAYQAQTIEPIAPWWIWCLWINFALTLNHSMSWLLQRRLLAGVFSAIASPISYYAGSRLGALDWIQPEILIVVLAISWGLAIPLLLTLAIYWRHQESGKHHAVV
jgi:hypothetical protein